MALGPYTSVVGYETPAPAGGDGIKRVIGTAVASDDYDTGGPTIDLTPYFNGKIYAVFATSTAADANIDFKFVAAGSYAAAGTKIMVTNGAGTEATSGDDHSSIGTGALVWVAYGTD
jgi:hypothetical protein